MRSKIEGSYFILEDYLYNVVLPMVNWLDSYNRRKTEPGWIDRKDEILECLEGRELSYNQIMRKTELEYSSVVWMLDDLERAKIIKSRSIAGTKLYSINDPLPSDAIL